MGFLQSTEHPNDSRHANDFLVEDVDDALGCGGGDFPLRDAFPSAKMNVARNGMDMDVAPYRTLRTSTPASTDTCTRDVATPRTPPCGSISLLAALTRTPVKACRVARTLKSIKVKHRQSKKTMLRPSTLYALSRHHMPLLATFQSCC